MGIRQEEELLPARAEAVAEQAAGPDGDQRLERLKAGAERIRFRTEEGEDARATVARRERRDDDERHRSGAQDQEQLRANPGDPEEHSGEHDVTRGGAEIRLEQDDRGSGERKEERRSDRAIGIAGRQSLPGDLRREQENEGDLEEFGGLEHHRSDRNPASGGVDRGLEKREDAQDEGAAVGQVHHPGPRERAVVDAGDEKRGDASDDERRDLLEEIAVGAAGGLRGRHRGSAVDHHAAEERQRHERREEDLVGRELTGHRPIP